jgi:hypothetical protein
VAAPTLPDLLRAYADGDREVQRAVLDEIEPLLFGYARSLAPSGEDAFERAVAATHEMVLGFHLRAQAGAVAIPDVKGLRAYAHRTVSRKLAAPPLPLGAVADEETNGMAPAALAVGDRIARELDAEERALLASRLLGEVAGDVEGAWGPLRERMVACGVLA